LESGIIEFDELEVVVYAVDAGQKLADQEPFWHRRGCQGGR
jgi:hypothetical protein